MTVLTRDATNFTQDATKASYVACPEGQQITVRSDGGTLYYKSTSDVTSGSNDGNIATAASSTFTTPQWVICAQGASTNVLVKTTEGDNANFRVGGNLVTVGTTTSTGASTSTGAQTLTGGVAGGQPWNVYTWEAPTATSGTDTACTVGTAYCGSVYVPMNCTITGIQFLVGSVGGTHNVVASLHSATGALLANSAQAGAVVGTAAQVQQVALTATYAAVGPAFYFLALTFSGTTPKFRTIPAHTQTGVLGNGVTQTFGTSASFTAPTSFNADKIPVMSIY